MIQVDHCRGMWFTSSVRETGAARVVPIPRRAVAVDTGVKKVARGTSDRRSWFELEY